MQVVICDIDGCLFDTGWIFEETEKLGLTGDDKWNYFHTHINDEKSCTCEKMEKFLTQVISKNIRILFMTARSEVIREETEGRIFNEFPELRGSPILMRPKDVFEPSDVVKEVMLKVLLKEHKIEVVLAIDDDPKNCAMFEKYGIPTLQWKICKNLEAGKEEEQVCHQL